MKFYIGQRVRIVRANWPEFLNKEATIIGGLKNRLFSRYGGGIAQTLGYLLLVDNMDRYISGPDKLEPIQPEGWKKISWKEMEDLWSPPVLTPSDAMV